MTQRKSELSSRLPRFCRPIVDLRGAVSHGYQRHDGGVRGHNQSNGQPDFAAVLPDLASGPRNELRHVFADSGFSASSPTHQYQMDSQSRSQRPERRQVTVMFVDLVGYTSLSEQYDPEILREWLRYYQSVCSEVVTRYTGYISRFVGDGVLVLFGYPKANGDDAQRAVRAALEIIETLKDRDREPLFVSPMPALAVRIGIATGKVVTGDIIGQGGAAEQEAIVGHTPNLASRLKDAADPDQVVVSELTHELIKGSVDCTFLGNHALKGFVDDIPIWRVDRVNTHMLRLASYYANTKRTLVGREPEMERLHSHLLQVVAGTGSVISISGQPGVGKSRLCASFIGAYNQRLDYESVFITCSSYHQNSPLYPLIEDIVYHAEIDAAADATDINNALREWCNDLGFTEPKEWMYFAQMFGTLDHSDHGSLGSPEKIREKLLEVLVRRFTLLAQKHPIVVVLEDEHWIDPSTHDFVVELCKATVNERILVLLTTRDEVTSDETHAYLSDTIKLPALDSDKTAELVAHTADLIDPMNQLDERTVTLICERADGIPLYAEELTKAALDLNVRKPQSVTATPDDWVPATLHDSLMSRLDRLGDAKIAAQLGATVGRSFSFSMIAELWDSDETSLREALNELQSAHILDEHTDSRSDYTFSHALIAEVAYDSQLFSVRAGLHQAIAQRLLTLDGQGRSFGIELVAQHFMSAGLPLSAAPYWFEASQRSLKSQALREAQAHAQAGLDAMSMAQHEPENLELELQLQIILGQVSIASSGHASERAHHAFVRAIELAQQLGRENHLFEAMWGITAGHYINADMSVHRNLSTTLIRLADQSQDKAQQVVAHCSKVLSHFSSGNFDESETHYKLMDAKYNADMAPGLVAKYSVDRKTLAMQFYSQAQWIRGDFKGAVATVERMQQHAQSLGHPFSQAQAFTSGANVYVLQHDYESLQQSIQKGKDIARKHNQPGWVDHSDFLLGWVKAHQGELSDGIEVATKALEKYKAGNARISMPKFYVMLAELHVLNNSFDKAQELLTTAQETVARSGECSHEAEIYRLMGICELRSDIKNIHSARDYFAQSAKLAQDQKARSWALRTAISSVESELFIQEQCEKQRVEDVAVDKASLRELLYAALEILPSDDYGPDVAQARQLLTQL